MPTQSTWGRKLDKLSELYSPAAPINSEKLFYGRKEELGKVHESVEERGLHVILYGERGVGKTSLANIVEQRYKNAITSKVTCNSGSTLAGIWKSTFKRIPVSVTAKRPVGFKLSDEDNTYIERISKISDMIDPSHKLEIDEITSFLDCLKPLKAKFLLIFDEFDQISNEGVIQGFSNIIKYLSDNILNVTVMVVGIGESIRDLIGEHHSIERCIRQIQLPRMSDTELAEIVLSATKELQMHIERNVWERIVSYSSGFPHYTHLLGKFTTRNALKNRSDKIIYSHFREAMTEAIANVNESIRSLYERAVLSAKEDTLFEQVLYACALVDTDEYGTFRATDLERYFHSQHGEPRKMQAFQYHLGKLCSEERGGVLEKITVAKSRSRYRIKNPLFKAYVRLRYHQQKDK